MLPAMLYLGEGRYMLAQQFVVEHWVEWGHEPLVVPQVLVEPLSLASVARALDRGEVSELCLSPDSPTRFEAAGSPKARDDLCLTLSGNKRLSVEVFTGRSMPPERDEMEEEKEEEEAGPDEEDDEWQEELLRLLAPLLDSYGCGPRSVGLRHEFDPRYFLAIPVPRRLKTVEQAVHIAEHALALINDGNLGPLTRQRVVEFVRAGFAESLVGQVEGPWLEGKGEPYRFENDEQKWELAKDVASFANADAGGVIVIGAHTKRRHGVDTIDAVKKIPLEMLNAESMRQSLRSKIRPSIEGLEIKTVDHGDGRGITYIHIPPQPDDLKPFVVSGVVLGKNIRTSFVSVPVRDGEGTAIAHVDQHLLQAGRAALRRGELPDP